MVTRCALFSLATLVTGRVAPTTSFPQPGAPVHKFDPPHSSRADTKKPPQRTGADQEKRPPGRTGRPREYHANGAILQRPGAGGKGSTSRHRIEKAAPANRGGQVEQLLGERADLSASQRQGEVWPMEDAGRLTIRDEKRRGWE